MDLVFRGNVPLAPASPMPASTPRPTVRASDEHSSAVGTDEHTSAAGANGRPHAENNTLIPV
jgi:hypothetical protein